MVSTQAEEGRLPGEIDKTIASADRLYNSLTAMDTMLSLIQSQLYSGDEAQLFSSDEAAYSEAFTAAKRAISDVHDQTDAWKEEISRLEKEFADLHSHVGRLPPGEKKQSSDRLEELRRVLDVTDSQMSTIEDRIISLLDRIMYLTERH
jgi:chromosome segregation ATPase